MSEQVKDCPFCGASAGWSVGVVGCKSCDIWARNEISWNQRAAPQRPRVDARLNDAPTTPCECYKCLEGKMDPSGVFPLAMTRMIVCRKCGNKRCPHATNHGLQCTNSNDPGQPGSRYA